MTAMIIKIQNSAGQCEEVVIHDPQNDDDACRRALKDKPRKLGWMALWVMPYTAYLCKPL